MTTTTHSIGADRTMAGVIAHDLFPAPDWAAAPVESVAWSRRNPFPATLLLKSLLSPAGEPRTKFHYEFSLEGSGLRYEPGDSLAVLPENDPALVDALLARLGLTGDEEVKGLDGSRCAMREVLERQATITKPSRRLREAGAHRRTVRTPFPARSRRLRANAARTEALPPRRLLISRGLADLRVARHLGSIKHSKKW